MMMNGLQAYGYGSIKIKYRLHLDFHIIVNETPFDMMLHVCVCILCGFGPNYFCPIVGRQGCLVNGGITTIGSKACCNTLKTVNALK